MQQTLARTIERGQYSLEKDSALLEKIRLEIDGVILDIIIPFGNRTCTSFGLFFFLLFFFS